MPTMNISLSDHLKDYVDEQVASGKYASASEYVRELVRLDQKNRERERIEMLVLEGLHSGEAVDVTPRMWDEIRQELRNRRKRGLVSRMLRLRIRPQARRDISAGAETWNCTPELIYQSGF